MKFVFIFYSIILIFIFSCNNSQDILNHSKTNSKPEFAKGFEIINYSDFKKIIVFDNKENTEYYLLPQEMIVPDSLKEKNIIKTPIKRVVCLSTTHLGYIENLDERESICGVSTAKLIYDSVLFDNFTNGKISEIGSFPNINIETIIALKPDLVFAYSISSSTTVQFEQLKKLGINIVFVNEFLETLPLGRAEWIKFFAAFYQKDSIANEYFLKIKNKYQKLKNEIIKNKNMPGVIVNIPFQGIWYLPGGNSYMANIINDAGGNYLWKNNKQNKSFTITLEEIYLKSDSLDFLLNPGSANSIDEILKTEKRISNLKFIKNKQVFNNNKRLNNSGGNDFWESGVVNPDIILHDLINIFSENDSSLFYYKRLY